MKLETNKTYGWHFSSFSVILIFVTIIIIGIAFIPTLNIQLRPTRNLPSLTISYSWYGASARVIEQEVTSKLEGVLSTVSGVQNISSISSKNNGKIEVSFRKGIDLDAVRFEISSLIRQLYPSLPYGVTYPEISASIRGERREVLLAYTLSAPSTPAYIQKYANDNIVPELSKIKGISNIVVYGAKMMEYEIVLNSKKAYTLNINSAEVENAIRNFFSNIFLGLTYNQDENNNICSYQVVLSCISDNDPQWNKIPIKKVGNRIIYLTDIARIRLKEQIPDQYFRINGLNTINMVIYSESGANHIKVARNVKEKVEAIKKKLSHQFIISTSYDSTEYIIKELKTILFRTALSIFLLMIFILFTTRQFRYLLIIFISLISNLLIAVIFYHLLKLEIHLYSLAGITVSFGIIIDNSIVMIDHFRHYKNRKVFLAILGATLTTIGGLCVIFFLKENQKINLIDFTWVILINLTVSLAIALFFIPALIDKIPLPIKKDRLFFRRKKKIVKFTNIYNKLIFYTHKWKLIFIIIFILGFGIPIHWLPQKIEKSTKWANIYNKTLGSEFFIRIRPTIEKIVGGTLRLFSEKVFEQSFYAEPERTRLYINASMPEGCTVQQLNETMVKMEKYLKQFSEIENFQTSIYDYNYGSIVITFKKSYETGYFPYYLKELVTSYAINLGGADWSIYGVGEGFSNALYSGFKSNRIILEGYNYEQLYRYAQILSDSLKNNPRVKDIEITSSDSWWARVIHEYNLNFNHELMTLYNFSLPELYSELRNILYKSNITQIYNNNEIVLLTLTSDETENFDVWNYNFNPVNNKKIAFSYFSNIKKEKSGHDIRKNNQQYQLIVAYDFIGPYLLAEKVMNKYIKMMENKLPLGYKVYKTSYGYWDFKEKKQYFLIILVIAIIFFVCSVLLESLIQPFAIITLIPLSFIGLFLTFYIFRINFDQGGFAAFIMLSGLTVNSGLYVLNDFNNLRKKFPDKSPLKLYLKAYNSKIIPIILTILSTVIGLIPFILGGQKEVFWYAFAAGTIGGLIFSLIVLWIYFPLFLKIWKNNKQKHINYE